MTGTRKILVSRQISSVEERATGGDYALDAQEAEVEFEKLVRVAHKGHASDLILKCGQVAMFKLNGELFPLRNGNTVDSVFVERLVSCICSPVLIQNLSQSRSIDFAYTSRTGVRLRINVFSVRGRLSLVGRLISRSVPTLASLGMERCLKEVMTLRRGLVLVCGATGNGKSTTLAAMVDHINRNRNCHILTIEDPIEFLHADRRSLVNQREIGVDAPSFADAMRSAMRQSPDVILLGELRDASTIEVALQAAETGHLVLSCLHSTDASEAITRLKTVMGSDKESSVRSLLADQLQAVVSQRLVKRRNNPGRVAAQEILISNSSVRQKILEGGNLTDLRKGLAEGARLNIQTFDAHLHALVKANIVEFEEALKHASNREDFALLFRGISSRKHAS